MDKIKAGNVMKTHEGDGRYIVNRDVGYRYLLKFASFTYALRVTLPREVGMEEVDDSWLPL